MINSKKQKGGEKKMGTTMIPIETKPVSQEKIKIPTNTCERCGHVWIQRINRTPCACPKCRSPYWDKPRRNIPSNKKQNE